MSDEVEAGSNVLRLEMPDNTYARGFVSRLGTKLVAKPAVIPINGTASGLVDCVAGYPAAIVGPAAWTAAALAFEFTLDGGVSWSRMRDLYREYSIDNFAAGDFLVLPPQDWLAVRQFRICSGLSGARVQQAAARTFSVLVAP